MLRFLAIISAQSQFSKRVSGFHPLELFTPFITLGSQRADELKISVVQTGMFLVSFGFSITNVRQTFAKVAVQLLDRCQSLLLTVADSGPDCRITFVADTLCASHFVWLAVLEQLIQAGGDSIIFRTDLHRGYCFLTISTVQFCSQRAGRKREWNSITPRRAHCQTWKIGSQRSNAAASVRRLSDSRILHVYLGTSAALSYALSRGNLF